MTEIIDIRKSPDTVGGLSGVSLKLTDRKIHGIFGEGTLLSRIISGITVADSGTVSVRGVSMTDDCLRARSLVGYVPCGTPLYADMTVCEYLDFVAEAKGLTDKKERRADIQKALDACGIDCIADILIKKLSQEARSRISIAQATLGSPDLIVIEEPFADLAPDETDDIKKLIKSLKKRFSVAIFCEVAAKTVDICDTISVIRGGVIDFFAETDDMNKARVLSQAFPQNSDNASEVEI